MAWLQLMLLKQVGSFIQVIIVSSISNVQRLQDWIQKGNAD